MHIGLVKLSSFKSLASLLKKRVEGCKHSAALESLAQACGAACYQHVLDVATGRRAPSPLLAGTQSELVEEWKRRLDSAFGVDVGSILSVDELDVWFKRVFVPRGMLVVDHGDDCQSVRHAVDPRLGAADWRDAEFRQWLHCMVDRSSGQRRSGSRGGSCAHGREFTASSPEVALSVQRGSPGKLPITDKEFI